MGGAGGVVAVVPERVPALLVGHEDEDVLAPAGGAGRVPDRHYLTIKAEVSAMMAAATSRGGLALVHRSPRWRWMVWLISAYQRYISPRKGFRCAYRAAHGRHSCSEFGKRAASRCGLLSFLPLLCRRFSRCARAAAHLKRRKSKPPVLECGPKRERKATDSALDCVGDCGTEACLDVDACSLIVDGASYAASATPEACPVDCCPADGCF